VSVLILTSVSSGIAEIAAATVPNKTEYALRHGYSLLVENKPYDEAISRMGRLCGYLDSFDIVWALDADAIITDMRQPLHELPCLGPHVTVCEEGIVEWNRINCGSVVTRNTEESRALWQRVEDSQDIWRTLNCGWQTWLGNSRFTPVDLVTVAPLRAFNSCVWNRPANARDEIGGHWQPGDFVYHPCGVYPHDERLRWIQKTLPCVTR